MTVTFYKEKGEKTYYTGINLLNMALKIYAGLLVNRLCIVTERLIYDVEREFRSGGIC